jgi:hypothetical protein
LFLGTMALSFWGACKQPLGSIYPDKKTNPTPDVLIKGAVSLICDFLYGGPRLLFTSAESFGKAMRLLDLDIPQMTVIILWLREKGAKVSVEEFTEHFSKFYAIQFLPQLRDIPGVIWLEKGHGMIIFSEEFRNSLASAFPRSSESSKTENNASDAGGQPRVSGDEAGEVAQWYKTLGLPPFAPIHSVKRKYRQLVKIYHPDVTRHKGPEVDDQIKTINAAYNNIMRASSNA